MYIPKHTEVTDKNEIFDIIENNSFAILITNSQSNLKATHIPMLLDRNEGELGTLTGHIAAANDQLSNYEYEALAIFQGVHKYISSSWYETNQSVPTWNYVSAHAYGLIEIKNEFEDKLEIVSRLVEFYEAEDSSYKVSSLDKNYLSGQLKGITAFSIRITRLEGKKKLSQNHSEQRQRLVIENLDAMCDDNAREISAMMKKNIADKNGG
jgi:transcriptional regulator